MTEFVYILENVSMPGLLKIGRTDRSVAERMAELSAHTGVPTDFTVVKEYLVLDSVDAERLVHERLADYRVSDNREFFRLDPEDAITIIDSILVQAVPKPRDFDHEDDLVARAVPVIAKMGVARPDMLQEALNISYDEALFVIQTLRGRGVLGEQNMLKVSVPCEPASANWQPAATKIEKPGFYQLPSFDLLRPPLAAPFSSKEDLISSARRIQYTLSKLGIEIALGDITYGDSVITYRLHLMPGVMIDQIQDHAKEIAMALKVDAARIVICREAASAVNVEVPNSARSKMSLRDVLATDEWVNSQGKIPLALGKDISGRLVIPDLTALPNLWIAGSTGSGKSVFVNSIVASLLFRFSPDQVRLIMIDLSRVEFQLYASLPHLVLPIVTDIEKAIMALRWAANEVEQRFFLFSRLGLNNIGAYNTCRKPTAPPPRPKLPVLDFRSELDEEIVNPREELNFPEKLSHIVVFVSGLESLLASHNPETSQCFQFLAGNARQSGVHLVIVSDRPALNVVPDTLSAEIPSRVAFRCESRAASRSFLGEPGAECLMGAGDMLFVEKRGSIPVRLQGGYISDMEILGVVDHVYGQAKPSFLPTLPQQPGPTQSNGLDEELIQQCIDVIRTEQKASASLLQRRLRLGYTLTARILDELENRGIVGPSKGAEPRELLID